MSNPVLFYSAFAVALILTLVLLSVAIFTTKYSEKVSDKVIVDGTTNYVSRPAYWWGLAAGIAMSSTVALGAKSYTLYAIGQ